MESDTGWSEEDEEDGGQYDSHQLGYNPQVQNGGYDPQLENVRMESIRKIRGRFEHIYEKYGKDFEGVADEIDMATGVIVVNNGHLQRMKHEVDAGNGDALALSRTFEDEQDEDEEEESSDSESPADLGRDEADESNSVSSGDPALDFSWQDDTAASLTSPDEDDHDDAPGKILEQGASLAHDVRPRSLSPRVQSDGSSQESAPEEIFGQMKDCMLAMKDKYQRGQDMAPGDIQALGMSIANQLASFIAGGTASKKRKRQLAPQRNEPIEPSRGRRRRRSHSRANPASGTPARSPGSKSLWAPLDKPKTRRSPRKKRKSTAAEDEPGDDSLIDSMVLQTIMSQTALEPDELQGPTTVRSCSNCKTTETLNWRRGPKAVDLCNNCGMYYYRYGLMRPLRSSPSPAKSPTPVEEQPHLRQKPAPYSANTSRPLEGVNLFGLHFSVREDAQIIKLKEIERLTWDQIAMQHPGRTPYALQCRYSKMLRGKPCEARDILSSRGHQFYVDANGNTVAWQPGEFTEQEDDLLLKLREEDKLEWDGVALELPGRTIEDVERRYDEMLAQYLPEGRDARDAHFQLRASSKKSRRHSSVSERSSVRYTPDEDNKILKLREDDKLSWQEIAAEMPGRTLASVQRHYSREIGPYGRSRSSTPRGSPRPGEAPERPRKYTCDEDAMLMRLRNEDDLDWEQIAEQMPARAASSLQNRYYYKVNKDSSRTSSRASSASSSPRRRHSRLVSEGSVAPQIGVAPSEGVAEDDAFTRAEDDLIIQLRELECLSWEQIAAEMPGRCVSSISCRYYQYLLPQKVPEIREEHQRLDPALHSNGSSLVASVAKVPALKVRRKLDVEDGNPAELDGRGNPLGAPATSTPGDSQVRLIATRTRNRGSSTASRRSDAPMLRRALQKGLNRRSESQIVEPAGLIEMSSMTDGANDEAVVDGGRPSYRKASHGSHLLPSDLRESHEKPRLMSMRKLRSGSTSAPVYLETPLQRSSAAFSMLDSTPVDSAQYLTPSKYDAQSHPYFLAETNSPDAGSSAFHPDSRVAADPTYANAGEYSERSDEETGFEDDESSFRERRRAAKSTHAALPRQILIGDSDEDDGDAEEAINEDGGEYFTSRRKKKRASEAQKSFQGKTPTARATRDQSKIIESTSRTRAPFLDLDNETEEEDVDMPDLGTDLDEASSDSEEDEDDDELRCNPRQRSPLFDPHSTIAEAKQKKEGRPRKGKLNAAATAVDGYTMDDMDTSIDVSNIPPEHLVRPDMSWTQLNFIALKSRAPEPLYTREIYAYLEEHFPFFRLCKGHWRDSIRGNLSTRPEFVKASDTKSALWRLADPDQDAVARPKGLRRGKCLGNIASTEKELELPKTKGRPSNASKGLPLKRIYAKNYVSAAERRRLAAIDAKRNAAELDQNRSLWQQPTTAQGQSHAVDALSSPTRAGLLAPVTLDNIDARPAPPSTIGDSEASQRSELIDPTASPAHSIIDIEVKAEPDSRLRPRYSVPAGRISYEGGPENGREAVDLDKAVSMDPNSAADELCLESTPLLRPVRAWQSLHSSPPTQASTRKSISTQQFSGTCDRTGSTTVTTPRTSRSNTAKRPSPARGSFFMKSSAAFTRVPRSSLVAQVATPPTRKRRVVQTPLRDAEESEDELA